MLGEYLSRLQLEYLQSVPAAHRRRLGDGHLRPVCRNADGERTGGTRRAEWARLDAVAFLPSRDIQQGNSLLGPAAVAGDEQHFAVGREAQRRTGEWRVRIDGLQLPVVQLFSGGAVVNRHTPRELFSVPRNRHATPAVVREDAV